MAISISESDYVVLRRLFQLKRKIGLLELNRELEGNISFENLRYVIRKLNSLKLIKVGKRKMGIEISLTDRGRKVLRLYQEMFG